MAQANKQVGGLTRTLGLTKRLYHRSLLSDGATTFEDECNATALISTAPDQREDVLSFIEKRSPHFIGN